MKLSQIVPRLSRATLGMPTGPETRATMPYDLLAGLERAATAGGCPEWPEWGWRASSEHIENPGNHEK